MITILCRYERISLYHTMVPFFWANRSAGRKIFRFTQSAQWCLAQDKNKILFMERMFQHREPRDLDGDELSLLRRLRDKYKTIFFFCGQPEAGTNRLDLLPYVDRLFYKSVFANRSDYQKDLYGKNRFADYYHRRYVISDDPAYRAMRKITDAEAARPELSWNIGVGTYPRRHWPQRGGTVLARLGIAALGRRVGGRSHSRFAPEPPPGIKETLFRRKRNIPCHARIDPVTVPSIAFQRRLFLKTIASSGREDLFLTGMTGQARYYRELEDSKIVLSPFGWGEVCFRDFEAILAGALLLKPDMSHLLTWPDVYIPGETYVPLKWDGSDLLEQVERYLDDETERNRIAANAREQYRNELAELPRRFETLLGELL